MLTGMPQGSFLVRPHDTPALSSPHGGESSDQQQQSQQQPQQQPQQSQQQLYFLSFVDKGSDKGSNPGSSQGNTSSGSSSSSSAQENGGGSIIKHAVVRKDFLINPDPSLAHELILAQGQGLGLAPGQGLGTGIALGQGQGLGNENGGVIAAPIPSSSSNLISEMFQPLSPPPPPLPLPQRYAYRCGKVRGNINRSGYQHTLSTQRTCPHCTH